MNSIDTSRNRLLTALEPPDLALLTPHLRRVSLIQGAVLQEQEAPVEHVYFPLSGLVSLVSVLNGGQMIETANVGREGTIGAFAGLGPWEAFNRVIVQIPGNAASIPTSPFQAAVTASERLRNLILRYKERLLAQVQQTAACNTLHPFEARLARWLLQAMDRVEDTNLALTQEFIAHMLGVRRTTVTVIAGRLQQENLITYRRGHIVILSRPGLERLACECYRTIRRRTDAGLPIADTASPSEARPRREPLIEATSGSYAGRFIDRNVFDSR
jgi:CRP-like cAMP-binding protein